MIEPESNLKRAPFRRVLHRPFLFMGGEREPTMIVLVLAGILVFNGMNLVAFIVGPTLWLLSIPIFRQMAKADPLMSKVYRRHIVYRGYYPARSRPHAGHALSSTKQIAILIGAPMAFFLLLVLVA